jgi:hypothetical protein
MRIPRFAKALVAFLAGVMLVQLLHGCATSKQQEKKTRLTIATVNNEVFDITRTRNEHLGFSLGIHFCLGTVLARMELTICLTTLLRRLPNLSGAPDKHAIPTHTSLVFKGFDSLPVKFDARLK